MSQGRSARQPLRRNPIRAERQEPALQRYTDCGLDNTRPLRINILASTGNEHVLFTALDIKITIIVDKSKIARVKPAVFVKDFFSCLSVNRTLAELTRAAFDKLIQWKNER